MTAYYRPTRVEVSLDALRYNIEAFRRALPERTRLMATVKADAYGHGAVAVAREAERIGVDYMGVAFLDEAIQLRQAGIAAPILVLGYVPAEGLAIARDMDIAIALFREDIIEAAAALPVCEGRKLRAHIKIDSGMGRLGLLPGQAALDFIAKAHQADNLEIEGIFTHFAKADETDKQYTRMQHERFSAFVREARQAGFAVPLAHAGNSAAGIDVPELAGGMVRLGISMYGLYPSAQVNRNRVPLQPVMSLKTELVMVKQAPPGWGISYGTRYITAGDEWIGTLPIGYADGYSRMLSGKAEALVRGCRVPVLGTICMDQCMIALDPVMGREKAPVSEGEEVVLIGTQGDAAIHADDLAAWLGTINYEVTCMLGARMPRLYIKDGAVIAVANHLLQAE